MIKTEEFEFASKEEALWIRVKEATEQRLKNYPERMKEVEEAIMIDTAFLKMINEKLKALNKGGTK